jgi:hypothetical protein
MTAPRRELSSTYTSRFVFMFVLLCVVAGVIYYAGYIWAAGGHHSTPVKAAVSAGLATLSLLLSLVLARPGTD